MCLCFGVFRVENTRICAGSLLDGRTADPLDGRAADPVDDRTDNPLVTFLHRPSVGIRSTLPTQLRIFDRNRLEL